MENRINIVELLKDCPRGMEMDCSMYNKVTLLSVDDKEDNIFPIKILREDGNTISLTKYGQYTYANFAKCIIFPKGKTTWEGFVPPCKFKDGDIIADEHGNIAIYKGTMWYNKKLAGYYCGYRKSDNHFLPEPKRDGHFGVIEELHHATEEEKQKLFDAIKAHGYKWNAETKTLEKLPRFKVGDRITTICNGFQYDIIGLTDTYYTLVEVEEKFKYTEPIIEDKNWELVPNKFDINTLKPFAEVLVRNTNNGRWRGQFYMSYDKNEEYPFECAYNCWKQCIPYKNNEHLFNKTDDCDNYYKNWE